MYENLSEQERMELVNREEKGTCESCGRPGSWMNDPYDRDLHNEETPVCLCEECAWQQGRNV